MLGGIRCREADALEQILETGLVAQVVHDGIDVQVDEPVGVVFVGFLEVIEGAVVFSEADVDSGEEVGRDVFAFGEAGEVVEDLQRFLFSVQLCRRNARELRASEGCRLRGALPFRLRRWPWRCVPAFGGPCRESSR